ncbi:MAG: starch synthase [Candidatus Kapaibacteriales bacterium]
MAKKLNVLFCSCEVYPFSKETGISDFSFSLPLALKELGNDLRVMMPKYGNISERKNRIHDINRLKEVHIPMGDTEEVAAVKSSSMTNNRNKVQAYITTNHTFYDSMKGIYHNPTTWEEYKNNDDRFIFFCKSVIQTCVLLEWYPDIIHCNDWPTAILPAMAKMLYPEKFKKTKFVYTVHSFNFQGDFPLAKTFKKTGLPEECKEHFTHKKQFNFMKGGLMYADHITTVSKAHEDKILNDKEYSNGLNQIIQDKRDSFEGILSGMDPYAWNPKRDNHIKAKLEDEFDEFKYENKVELCNRFELEYHPKRPIISMVSRIDKTKGFELLIEAIDRIMEHDLQFIILGQGETDLRKELQKIAKKYPDKFKFKVGFNDELSHIMTAGSDFFLISSEYEAIGMNYMTSSVYGTVPIARVSGGMKEYVTPWDPETEEGNSFVFEDFTADALYEAVERALDAYKDSDTFETIAKNGLYEEYGWEERAVQYDKIYRNLLKSKKK